MLNPNKAYKAKSVGVIIQIDLPTEYFPSFLVEIEGKNYAGFIKDIPNFKRFKLGDRVKVHAKYYILSESFRIVSMRKTKE
jgi:hypothetical protein